MKRFACALMLMVVVCPAAGDAADWPQWRGPNRNGISADSGLLQRWPKGGPRLVRTVKGLGNGYASQVIAGG